jgi:transposase
MANRGRYSQEFRERAVRMVFEHTGEYDSEWEAICSIAEKIGCSSESLRKWVRQAEIDSGRRGGLTSDEQARIKELERNHQGLDNELIEKPRDEPYVDGDVDCRERLGGVLNYYYRRAA